MLFHLCRGAHHIGGPLCRSKAAQVFSNYLVDRVWVSWMIGKTLSWVVLNSYQLHSQCNGLFGLPTFRYVWSWHPVPLSGDGQVFEPSATMMHLKCWRSAWKVKSAIPKKLVEFWELKSTSFKVIFSTQPCLWRSWLWQSLPTSKISGATPTIRKFFKPKFV